MSPYCTPSRQDIIRSIMQDVTPDAARIEAAVWQHLADTRKRSVKPLCSQLQNGSYALPQHPMPVDQGLLTRSLIRQPHTIK